MTKRAYIGVKFYEDNRNQNEIQAISKRLNQAGYDTICIARDVEKWGTHRLTPQRLMQITFEEIDQSDLVVMEMSVKGVGLGIEAGYAYAKEKPIVVLIKEGRDLSETMAGTATEIIRYQNLTQIEFNASRNHQDLRGFPPERRASNDLPKPRRSPTTTL